MADPNEQEIENGSQVDDVDARGILWKSKKSNPACGIMPVTVDSDVYKMDSSCRGRCIIFNIKDFDPHTKMAERRGSDVDAVRLYHCFRCLDFDVSLYRNLSKGEILNELKRASKMDHKDNDSFVCVILTHGDQGVIFGRDGKFNVHEIYEPFVGDVCPSLAGKPKLFFIQACQGDRLDHGFTLRGIESSDSSPSYKIPSFADLLIAYSTVPGFYSWRNTTKGSWFIQTLCSVFEKYGKEMELLEMLTLVNRNVAYNFESCVPDDVEMHMKKQIPCFTSMLTRKVYFTPKS